MIAKRILIVDDNADLRKGVRKALQQRFECEVFEARNGFEGLVIAKKTLPHVIILDYNMPDLTGDQVLLRLRQEAVLKNTRAIVVTGANSREDVEMFARLGVDSFLVKPFVLSDLLKRVAKALELYRPAEDFSR